MENYNNLKFKTYKINEKVLNVPMKSIKQEYDDISFSNTPYLFKILYISKYIKKTNEFVCYLAPSILSKLPIVKATIPLEFPRTIKIIPGYSGDLTDNELYILNERKFRQINQINIRTFNKIRFFSVYILCYGYLVNRYKDDDIMTKEEEGIQEFRLLTKSKHKFKDRNYETTCYITDKEKKLFKVYKLPDNKDLFKFKELPDKFFLDKKS